MPFVLETNSDGFVTSVFFENTAPKQKYSPPKKTPENQDESATRSAIASSPSASASPSPSSTTAATAAEPSNTLSSAQATNSAREEEAAEEESIDLEQVKLTELGGEPLTRSLAEVLISTLMDVLFLRGFSIPEAQCKKQEAQKAEKPDADSPATKEYGPVEQFLLWFV